MLKLDIKVGESIKVGNVELKLEHKSGQLARFSIVNPAGAIIERSRRPVASPDTAS